MVRKKIFLNCCHFPFHLLEKMYGWGGTWFLGKIYTPGVIHWVDGQYKSNLHYWNVMETVRDFRIEMNRCCCCCCSQVSIAAQRMDVVRVLRSFDTNWMGYALQKSVVDPHTSWNIGNILKYLTLAIEYWSFRALIFTRKKSIIPIQLNDELS